MAIIHHYTQVSSTLDVLHELAARGAPHGTVVVAEEQLEGRGSRGRTWHSPPGGLWYSILCRPGEAAVDVLSLRVGLAVARTMEAIADVERIPLKWPNDVMLGDRKLGGLLCEARWAGSSVGWVAVGIGINVEADLPEDLRATARNLSEVAPGVTPDRLIEPLTAALLRVMPGEATLTDQELREFELRDWLRGRHLR